MNKVYSEIEMAPYASSRFLPEYHTAKLERTKKLPPRTAIDEVLVVFVDTKRTERGADATWQFILDEGISGEASSKEAQLESISSSRESSSEKLERELEAFERLRPMLLQEFQGYFVAVHNGKVIDHDKDDFALAARVELKAMEEGPIAICKVCERTSSRQTEYPYLDFESPLFEDPQP